LVLAVPPNAAKHGLSTGAASRIVAPAVNLSATPGSIRSPAPEFGQHTEEVLLEAGFDWHEVGA